MAMVSHTPLPSLLHSVLLLELVMLLVLLFKVMLLLKRTEMLFSCDIICLIIQNSWSRSKWC